MTYSPATASPFEDRDVTDDTVLGGLRGAPVNGLALEVEARCGSLWRGGGDAEWCESIDGVGCGRPSVMLKLFGGLSGPGCAFLDGR